MAPSAPPGRPAASRCAGRPAAATSPIRASPSTCRTGGNVTGDTYVRDEDGYYWYQARSDDMIVSAGYNIAGPEVEGGLLSHPAVAEAGVVGAPDASRGQIVKAYVVLRQGETADEAMAKALQDHVKAELAPYKYPRAVVFVDALPRTETGKLQRFALRERAAPEVGGASGHGSHEATR